MSICFVTAYKDIKRDWPGGTEGYINHFKKLARTIEYTLVVYVEDEVMEKLKGEEYKTNINFERMEEVKDAFIYKYARKDEEILKSERYKRMIPENRKSLSEHTQKGYNLINHSKINFIAETKRMYQGYKYYGWVDFGRFNGETGNIPKGLNEKLLSDVSITCQSPHGIPEERITPDEMLKNHGVYILGACYTIPSILVNEVERKYEEKMKELYKLNITDDDQNILIQLYWDNPEMFTIIRDEKFYNLFQNLNKKEYDMEIWSQAKKRFERYRWGGIRYLTVSTKQNHVLDILERKVHEQGDILEILKGEHGKDMCAIQYSKDGVQMINRKIKLDLLKEYMKGVDDEEIIVFTDAYDVAYQGNLCELKRRFIEHFTKPIVFGAEPTCYPDEKLSKFYPDTENGNKYLNSGIMIGRGWAIKKCIEEIKKDTEIICDQLWWSQTFLRNQDLIELDYNRKMFLNLVWIRPEELTKQGSDHNESIMYKGKLPVIIHGNGPAKKTFYIFCIEPLVRKYGISENIHEEIQEMLEYPNGWP